MKDIKRFKYIDTNSFERFIREYGYRISDINGYSVGWTEQYQNNLLRVYIVYFNNGEYKLFRVLYLKDLL